ncbi:hypothetical protein Tco_0914977 [Tanacetum coccineum]
MDQVPSLIKNQRKMEYSNDATNVVSGFLIRCSGVWPSSHFRKVNSGASNYLLIYKTFLYILLLIVFVKLLCMDQQAHSTTLKTWVSRVGDVMAARPKFLARFKASSEAIYGTYGGAGVLNYESLLDGMGDELTVRFTTHRSSLMPEVMTRARVGFAQIPWTTKEEIALAKGLLAVSENSKHGNTRKQARFWCEQNTTV